MSEQDVPTAAFATRLNHYIRTRRQPDGSAWSVPAVAAAIGVSRQHMWNLSKGSASPKWEVVCALADLFDTKTDAFAEGLDEEERRRDEAMTVFSRAGREMSVERLESVVSFIQLLEHQRGLDKSDDNDTDS
ncbi:helix-turn-helix domain-containing protein [Saccharopolyspora sp. NPDC049357]|uniref:helix-turn-helix domain-containing protein n=1 Tax=Saccharopolyspora sp. NPDC049357 TaxID=3154507 RepID=UPI0034250226